jgi:hypothetical protein
VRQIAGAGKTGKDIFPGKARVVGEKFLLGLACGKLFENELDIDAFRRSWVFQPESRGQL